MAAHVGASRTPQEVMEHYVSMYIHGNLGKACIPDTIPNRVTDHTCPSGGPLSPSLTTPLPPLDISVAEQHALRADSLLSEPLKGIQVWLWAEPGGNTVLEIRETNLVSTTLNQLFP